MAYCVNCGVELDTNLKKCPLCNTPVYFPQMQKEDKAPTFPKRRGEVEPVNRKDMIIFISGLFFSIMLTCTLLNVLVFDHVWWSIPVVGGCFTIWIFFIAAVVMNKISIYGMIFADMAAMFSYMFMISLLVDNQKWLYHIAAPIIFIIFLQWEIVVLLSKKLPFSIWVGALYFFSMIAITCVSVEIILDLFFTAKVYLSWSAIVLTVCVVILVMIILVLMMGRLRSNINRRLHF